MSRTDEKTYAAGKRDGLSRALEIIDNRLGPEHLKGMQPDELRPYLLEITAAIQGEIASLSQLPS